MASRIRPSITKRNREQARRERQVEKAAKRSDRAAERRKKAEEGGEDPDLAGIVAGPQAAEGETPEGDKPDGSE